MPCWLATVDANGWPNVTPKETFAACGNDRLLIAHIASPGSVRNIRHAPAVCVSFIDIFVQTGYNTRGRATIVPPSAAAFETLAAPLERITQGQFPIHAIIDVRVDEVAVIRARSYQLHEAVTEQGMIDAAMRACGVQAGDPDSG